MASSFPDHSNVTISIQCIVNHGLIIFDSDLLILCILNFKKAMKRQMNTALDWNENLFSIVKEESEKKALERKKKTLVETNCLNCTILVVL